MRKLITRQKHVRNRPHTEEASVNVRKHNYTVETAFMGGVKKAVGKVLNLGGHHTPPAAVKPKEKAPHRLIKAAHAAQMGAVAEHHAKVAALKNETHGKIANIASEAEAHMKARNAKAQKIRATRKEFKAAGYKVIGKRAHRNTVEIVHHRDNVSLGL